MSCLAVPTPRGCPLIDAGPSRIGEPPATARWSVVLVLMLATLASYADRYVVSLVVGPIKHDFHVNDTQVSLLQGLAFSLVLVAAGVPLGRFIDRSRRMTIIAVGIALWSAMTMACGLVGGFVGLLVCRIFVAVGEATLTPAAFSILTDVVPRRRLGLANGILIMGVFLGAGLAFIGGAAILPRLTIAGGISLPLVGHLRPWQGLFLVIGALGLPLALWAACLREPVRTGRSADIAEIPLGDIVVFGRSHAATLTCLFLCAGFAALCGQAYAAWMPSLLIRSFGWSIAEAARSSGLVIIVGGLLGVLTAGIIGDGLVVRGYRTGRVLTMVAGALCAVPFAVAAPLMSDPRLTLVFMTLSTFFTTILLTSAPPTLQEILPNRMQGAVFAVYVLVVNFVGLGVGPTAVALVTDYGLRDEHRLGEALAGVSLVTLALAVVTGMLALGPYRASRAALDGHATMA